MNAEFLAWRDERNRILRDLDIVAARRQMPSASDDVIRIALHKGRYECTDIDDAIRGESAAWLRDRGYGRMTGEPLLPSGELPK